MSIEFYNYPVINVDEECAICKESFDATRAIVAHDCKGSDETSEKVKHVFDKECMKGWIQEHESCPLCKGKISPNSITQVFGLEPNSGISEDESSIAAIIINGDVIANSDLSDLTEKETMAALATVGMGVGAGYMATQLATSVGCDKELAINFGITVGVTVSTVAVVVARKFKSFLTS